MAHERKGGTESKRKMRLKGGKGGEEKSEREWMGREGMEGGVE